MSMSSPHVVLMNVAATGHVNPTLALVAELRSRGCQVSYFVEKSLREMVEAAGATWYPFRYPYGDPERTGTLKDLDEVGIAKYVPEGTLEHEYKQHPAAMIYNAEVVLPTLLEDLQSLKPRPSVIVYDPFISFARVAGHVLQIPAICSLTMPGPGVLPKSEALIQDMESKPWVDGPRKHIMEKYGFDVFKGGLQQEFYSPTLNLVTTIDELFAQPTPGLQAQRYGNFPFKCVGPMVDFQLKRIENVNVGTVASVPKTVEDTLLPDIDESLAAGRQLVFVSMGTVATGKFWNVKFGPLGKQTGLEDCTGKEISQHVFRTCFEAMGEDDRIIVVLAIGAQEDALEGLPEIPSNFRVRQSVPQLEILKRASAFITHGGANGMHESALLKVPMAVVPLFADQPSNATSVANCGAGLAFHRPLGSLTCGSLQSAIDQLMEQSSFREAVTQLSSKCKASGGAPAAADAIMKTASCNFGMGGA